MFEIPQLPPVAAAVVAISGVVLAVIRLLTASKAFWWKAPEWVQKGLPALLVALGTLPQALELARSWLDVAVALVLAAGVWFTASRGDKRPPENKDGGAAPRRSNSDPQTPPWNDVNTPPSLPGARLVGLTCAFLLLIAVGCSGFGQGAAKELSDPCSKLSWATVAAGCELRIERECVAGDRSCVVYQECTRARKEWQACK